MRERTLVGLNALLVGVALALLGFGGRRTVPVLLACAGAVTLVNRVSPVDALKPPARARPGWERGLWLAFGLFTLYYLVRQYAENLIAISADAPRLRAALVLIQNGLLFWILACIMVWGRRLAPERAFDSLLAGIGVLAALNLALDLLAPGMRTYAGESRFDWAAGRWAPPLVRSSATAAMAWTVVACTALITAAGRWRGVTGSRGGQWGAAFVCAVTAWAAVKCQFRAHLATLAVALVLALLPSLRLRRWALVGAFSLMVLFPTLFVGRAGQQLLPHLPIEAVLRAVGSRTVGAGDLSGRAEVYSYGWQRLGASHTALVGDGPVLRNALPALNYPVSALAARDYRMAFHSTALDALVQHGLVLGGLLLAGLGLLTWRAAAQIRTPIPGSPRTPADGRVAAYLTFWFTISIMDGGLASLENLLLAVLPAFGLLFSPGARPEPAPGAGRWVLLPARAARPARAPRRSLPVTVRRLDPPRTWRLLPRRSFRPQTPHAPRRSG